MIEYFIAMPGHVFQFAYFLFFVFVLFLVLGVTVFKAAAMALKRDLFVRALADRRNSLTLLHISSIGLKSGLYGG